MSESNIDRVRRGYEAYNTTRRIPFEMLDPEIELRLPAIEGQIQVYTGHEGVADGLGEMLDFFREMRFDVADYVERGDEVAVVVRMSGKGAGSGADVEGFALHEWKIREGVATHWHVVDWFTTPEAAAETMWRRDAVRQPDRSRLADG
jgi:predicted SnoaL-like aldol condensation-catalyzing enzyme